MIKNRWRIGFAMFSIIRYSKREQNYIRFFKEHKNPQLDFAVNQSKEFLKHTEK